MSFCQPGEKAYLRVNGSEVWAFDGPITVAIKQNPGKLIYPSTTKWVHVEYYFQYTDGSNYTQYIARFTFTGLKSLSVRETGNWHGYGPLRYVVIETYTNQRINYTGGDFAGWTPAFTNASNNFTAWMFPEIVPIQPGNIILRVLVEGIFAPPTQSPPTYELLVNGNILKTSNSPIIYTVRCGDRCPPGTTWNERCKACVCDDMGAIKAGLKGATAIARSIK